MSIDERTLDAFLADARIADRVKIEDYLAVAQGARPTGSLMVPAELPSGDAIRGEIDEVYAKKFYSGGGRRGLLGFIERTRLNIRRLITTPLAFRAELIRSSFDEVVANHEEYVAHREWAERLGMSSYQKSLRPSLDDLFVPGSDEALERVSRVMGMRDKIREEAQQHREMSPVFLPEEMSSIFLDAMGVMLGYPTCCVNAYIADTEKGLDAGARASEQLAEFEGAVDPAAYFAAYFYPCRPDCPEALATGRNIRSAVGDLRAGLDEMAELGQRENMEFVLEYREIVRRRQEEIRAKIEEAGLDDRER
ncbi:MAG: DUF483 domain-containing protein [Bacillota bacterium]